MNFGEKLKSLRASHDWTQPQAAQTIGVEQSYLSKLENNHSIPSSEVFSQIIQAFNVTVTDIIQDLDMGSLKQLRQIPDVDAHLTQREYASFMGRKLLILGLVIAVALGVACIYAGISHLFFSDTMYSYQSSGVIQAGESKELFRNPAEMQDRLNEQYMTSSYYRGDTFNVPVEGGSRTYYLTNEVQIDAWQNKAVTFLGIFLVIFGVLGLVITSVAILITADI
ncbi:MAG: helix-turn-helix transcriptional regulator [Pseudomonadota bacterium]